MHVTIRAGSAPSWSPSSGTEAMAQSGSADRTVGFEAHILGASGFGGAELMRLLVLHPHCVGIHAYTRGGETHIAQLHPHLAGAADVAMRTFGDWSALETGARPVLFAALPHGEFARLYADRSDSFATLTATRGLVILDLSGDFRLAAPADFERDYGYPHPCAAALGTFEYGLSEWLPQRLHAAMRIANPGCFATALQLGLLPLADLGVGDVFAAAATGSSGSGAKPGEGTHHPLRARDFRAYKMLAHQHEGEVLRTLRAENWKGELIFVPQSAPMVRGIFASLSCVLPDHVGATELAEAIRARYDGCRFIRIVKGSPRVAAVAGSNFADIGYAVNGRKACVMVAIDNLVKGMAGQAVQNLNLALGLAEDSGLRQAPLMP